MNVTDLPVSFAGKVVLVTGSNGHMGFAAASEAARRGAKTVIAATRTAAEFETTKKRLLESVPGVNVSIDSMVADLSSMASIRTAASGFLARHEVLDVLIHEAGCGGHPNVTADGYTGDIEINHLGPAFLTELVMPVLSQSIAARVVYIASEMAFVHNWTSISVADTIGKASTDFPSDKQGIYDSYSFSKFLVIQYAAEQALRHPKLTVFSVNPGYSGPPSDWPSMRFKCGDMIRFTPCPQLPQQGVTSAIFAAAETGIEFRSGALIDYHTTQFTNGTYFQSGDSCIPRPLPWNWTDAKRSQWYDYIQSVIKEKSNFATTLV